MIADLFLTIQRWRRYELVLHVVFVGLFLVTVVLLYTDATTLARELGLVLFFALWLVAWYVVVRKLRTYVQRLSGQIDYQTEFAFDSLYKLSPVAYLTINREGQVLYANPAAAHLFADTIDLIDTRNIYAFLDAEKAAGEDVGLRRKVAAGVTVTDVELPIMTLTGEPRWVLINVFATQRAEERLISVTDVTEQHAVDTAKSEFVALATHQLRTPVAAIRWNADLLTRSLQSTQTEKQAKYLAKVNRNVLRMLSLINDFLSVSQLEMGTYTAEREVVNFAEYLTGIVDEFEEKIVTKKLDVTTTLDPTDFRVSIDRRLFHIIASNLLSNAVKYTPTGGAVHITAVAQGGSLQYQVVDTGIGIPVHEQAQLFTKFFRASNAKTQVMEGTGLGLSVVKQSVELLGGTLTVASEENQGTTFVVTLPGVVEMQ